MKLDRDRIVTEAIALLNDQGLAGVSLRNVATRVSARAPSLAHHVGDKEQLLTLMAERIFRSCLATLPPCADWREWLRAFAHALWRAQGGTRDAARLIAMASYDPARFAALTEDVVRPLVALGVERPLALSMQSSVQALVTGWTTFVQSAGGGLIAGLMPIRPAFDDSVEALIAGWAVRSGETAAEGRTGG